MGAAVRGDDGRRDRVGICQPVHGPRPPRRSLQRSVPRLSLRRGLASNPWAGKIDLRMMADEAPALAHFATLAVMTPAERLAAVRREIADACRETRRDPTSVTLVA